MMSVCLSTHWALICTAIPQWVPFSICIHAIWTYIFWAVFSSQSLVRFSCLLINGTFCDFVKNGVFFLLLYFIDLVIIDRHKDKTTILWWIPFILQFKFLSIKIANCCLSSGWLDKCYWSTCSLIKQCGRLMK